MGEKTESGPASVYSPSLDGPFQDHQKSPNPQRNRQGKKRNPGRRSFFPPPLLDPSRATKTQRTRNGIDRGKSRRSFFPLPLMDPSRTTSNHRIRNGIDWGKNGIRVGFRFARLPRWSLPGPPKITEFATESIGEKTESGLAFVLSPSLDGRFQDHQKTPNPQRNRWGEKRNSGRRSFSPPSIRIR